MGVTPLAPQVSGIVIFIGVRESGDSGSITETQGVSRGLGGRLGGEDSRASGPGRANGPRFRVATHLCHVIYVIPRRVSGAAEPDKLALHVLAPASFRHAWLFAELATNQINVPLDSEIHDPAAHHSVRNVEGLRGPCDVAFMPPDGLPDLIPGFFRDVSNEGPKNCDSCHGAPTSSTRRAGAG